MAYNFFLGASIRRERTNVNVPTDIEGKDSVEMDVRILMNVMKVTTIAILMQIA